MLSDTSAAAQAVQDDILRKLSPAERLRIVSDLTVGIQQMAFAALRQQNSRLSDDEIWLTLAARRLGDDVVRRVYGRR